MASAVTETAEWVGSVIGPDVGDPRTAASVRSGLEDLARRSTWLRGSLVDVQGASFSGFTTLFSGSGYQNVADGGAGDVKLTFTNVEVGDKILLMANLVSLDDLTGAPQAVARFGETAAGIVCVGTTQLTSSHGYRALFGFHTAAADEASRDIFLQVDPSGATSLQFQAPVELFGIHLRRS